MSVPDAGSDRTLAALRERAKELHCLYSVHELLSRPSASVDEICRGVVASMPHGWQYPEACFATIDLSGRRYGRANGQAATAVQHATITVAGEAIGAVDVYYTREFPPADEGPFLKEERKLIDTIAERLADFAVQRGLAGDRGTGQPTASLEWPVVIEFLRRTDAQAAARVARRMINHLCWIGVERAQVLLASYASAARGRDDDALDDNRPIEHRTDTPPLPAEEIFALAAEHMTGREILDAVERWIRDDKGGFLSEAVDHLGTTVADIAQALDRFQQLSIDDRELSPPTQIGLRVALARRLLTDDTAFIEIAKDYLRVGDYAGLLHRVITPIESHGKIGGKGAGLLLAGEILRQSNAAADVLDNVRVPNTWYIASDALLDFVEYNHLEDVHNRKYLEIDQVRRDYPHVIQVFKHSHFSPEIVKGLSVALDDLHDGPLIVRSSSLLEDRMGAAFSGKYKSLFVANQGTKRERLNALLDAIAEVYASVFGPDPIEYRAERRLLHFHEEMAILVQEVVGTRVGRYFLPVFAGVAFSTNEMRWSPRIRRDDGLVRLVPGLGTRAVDRLSDDYPVLLAPGQPGLRVNATPDEVVRYSPRKVDVIDLESRQFASVPVAAVLSASGGNFPAAPHVFSVVDPDGTIRPAGFHWDPSRQTTVVTFEGLIDRTPFVARIRALLRVLADRLGGPVDLEFASDGKNLYLLQCRRQSFSGDTAPARIPRDVPRDRILFSADRYVSSGRVTDLTHIVYVDAEAYQALGTAAQLREVGRIIGRLNMLLPKRRFVLMGPGRWGSRGDIRLGVSVTYSDINNAALLVEIARARGSYVPDLSFGTHFFQDLVESGIRYLPLYPGDPGVVFDDAFLLRARNRLGELVPDHAEIGDVVRVIDVPRETGGMALNVVMNGDLDEALGYFAPRATGASAS